MKLFSLKGVFLPKDLPLRKPRYRDHSEDFVNLRNDFNTFSYDFRKAYEEAVNKYAKSL